MYVNNVPYWAADKKYMTIRVVYGEARFYDVWDEDELEEAVTQAVEIKGHVIPVEAVEI